MPDMHPGQKIRTLRKARGLSLDAVAVATERDKGNLSKLERGEIGYSHDVLSALAEILQCDIWQFFTEISPRAAEIARRWDALPDDLKVEIQSILLKNSTQQPIEKVQVRSVSPQGAPVRNAYVTRRTPLKRPGGGGARKGGRT